MESKEPSASPTNRPSRNRMAALEQDTAAGGTSLRKMRVKTGDVVTVSLSVSSKESHGKGTARIILRFKWGGGTVQRPVATVEASSRSEALKLGWKAIRENKIVEKEGWSWVVPAP